MLRIFSFIACSCLAISVRSQVYLAKKWDHTFGGSDLESPAFFIQTADSGFVCGGYTRSDSSGDVTEPSRGGSDFWIFKIDTTGHLQWDKRFGGTFEDRLFSIDLTLDGGLILGGFVTSDSGGDVSEPSHGSMDFWIIRTDATGHKLWDHRYGGSDYDQLSTVRSCRDGGFILGGWTYSDSTGDVSQHSLGGEDFWVIKVDSTGNKEWDHRYGGDMTEELSHLAQTSDGGFIFGGFTLSDSTGDVTEHTRGSSDMWIVRTDSLGNILWNKRFGGNYGEGLSSLLQTPDGGFIFSGGTGSDSTGDVTQPPRDTSTTGTYRGDLWLVKTDSIGNKIWDKRFGGNYIDGSSGKISRTHDGGFLLGSTSYSNMSGDKSENNFGSTQPWVLKIDSAGNIIWDKTLFTLLMDGAPFAIESSEGCYTISCNSQSDIGGYKTEPSKGTNDFWVIKFCESEVPQLPVANFAPVVPLLCQGGCFDFNNLSANASLFQWYFPGGNPSTSTNISPTGICYPDTGHFAVTLIAMNNDGNDTVVINNSVTVTPLPSFSIVQGSDTLYAPQGMIYYQWYLNSAVLASDTNYFHVVTQNGDYSVLVLDSNNCPGWDTIYSVTTGLKPMTMDGMNLYLYPNPARDYISVRGNGTRMIESIRIYDLPGKRVLSRQVHASGISLPVSDLKPGLYLVEVVSDMGSFYERFIRE